MEIKKEFSKMEIGKSQKRAPSAKSKSFNPKAKTFNPTAKAFNPRGLKPTAKSFNPAAQAFKPPFTRSHSSPAVPRAQSTPVSVAEQASGSTTLGLQPVFERVDRNSGGFLQQESSQTGHYASRKGPGVVDHKQGMVGYSADSKWGIQGLHTHQGLHGLDGVPRVGAVGGLGGQGGGGMQPQMYHEQVGVAMQYAQEPMGMEQMEGFDWEAEREDQKRILLPLRRPVSSFFMPADLAASFEQQNRLLVARLQPEDREFYRLPITIDHERYHSLWPLPETFDATPVSYSSHCYKVTSTKDGFHYVLRRVMGNHSEKYASKAIAPWIRIHKLANGCHPNIVAVRTVFESQDFDEGKCLCFVYDYHPGAVPVAVQCQILESKRGLPVRCVAPEHMIWSYFQQLISAVVSVHSQGLAALNINIFRVLVESNRLRINFCGLNEALRLVPGNLSTEELQFQDIQDICRLIMTIACRTLILDAQTERRAYEVMKHSYSGELCGILKFVLFTRHDTQKIPTAWDVQSLAWHRMVDEVQQAYTHIDYLENQLLKEHQNGRLFSLIAKLGFINERPEFKNNPKWSETGDRYLVKLLRDFIFHSVSEDGRPQIDLGHVVNSLNKLDAASPEKTLLTSRNQDSMLVVSYKELNRCVRAAFDELREAAETPSASSG
ncbi:hypothetical protein AAMO2058_000131400 [Amorphochlora amoebiformis]